MRNIASNLVFPLSLFTFLAVGSTSAFCAAADSQTVRFDEKVTIPGATLKSGSYAFSVEDRLADRAIVRISSDDSDQHYLLLAVPAADITSYQPNNLALFASQDGKTGALKAWKCPDCSTGLEFVYPKADAAKLTSESADSVLAYDPEYDKLPANLSSDDMKVVSLWLLSPQRVSPGHKGEGLAAAKYTGQSTLAAVPSETSSPAPTAPIAPTQPTAASALASAPEPPVALASDVRGGRLPKTSSNVHLYGLLGLLASCMALGLHLNLHTKFRKASSR